MTWLHQNPLHFPDFSHDMLDRRWASASPSSSSPWFCRVALIRCGVSTAPTASRPIRVACAMAPPVFVFRGTYFSSFWISCKVDNLGITHKKEWLWRWRVCRTIRSSISITQKAVGRSSLPATSCVCVRAVIFATHLNLWISWWRLYYLYYRLSFFFNFSHNEFWNKILMGNVNMIIN